MPLPSWYIPITYISCQSGTTEPRAATGSVIRVRRSVSQLSVPTATPMSFSASFPPSFSTVKCHHGILLTDTGLIVRHVCCDFYPGTSTGNFPVLFLVSFPSSLAYLRRPFRAVSLRRSFRRLCRPSVRRPEICRPPSADSLRDALQMGRTL